MLIQTRSLRSSRTMQVEANARDNEQVHGGDILSVITRKDTPSLACGLRRLTIYLATLDCATSNPSLSSSPWMRGASQSGFSMLIRRISARSSVSTRGRPPRRRDSQRQQRRKPALCQRTSVSGRMIVRTFRIDGNQQYSWIKNRRSWFVSRTRPRSLRLKMTN
jgi:hypothetical protein